MSDEEYEAALAAACRAAAQTLLASAGELGWGAGRGPQYAYENALGWLDQADGRPAAEPRQQRPRRPSSREVWDRDDWRCKHCGTHRNLTVDHITPRVKGGTDDLDNLQTLCGSCNSRKGAR